MLVLKVHPSRGPGARVLGDHRGPGDSVQIRVPPGEKERVILVTFLEHAGYAIRLGFTADEDIVVLREELVAGKVAGGSAGGSGGGAEGGGKCG